MVDGGQQIKLEDIPPVSRDPKDDIFLATATVSGAQYLVTEDKDLLVLNPYQNIRILDALEFLQVLQTQTDPEDKPQSPDT